MIVVKSLIESVVRCKFFLFKRVDVLMMMGMTSGFCNVARCDEINVVSVASVFLCKDLFVLCRKVVSLFVIVVVMVERFIG